MSRKGLKAPLTVGNALRTKIVIDITKKIKQLEKERKLIQTIIDTSTPEYSINKDGFLIVTYVSSEGTFHKAATEEDVENFKRLTVARMGGKPDSEIISNESLPKDTQPQLECVTEGHDESKNASQQEGQDDANALTVTTSNVNTALANAPTLADATASGRTPTPKQDFQSPYPTSPAISTSSSRTSKIPPPQVQTSATAPQASAPSNDGWNKQKNGKGRKKNKKNKSRGTPNGKPSSGSVTSSSELQDVSSSNSFSLLSDDGATSEQYFPKGGTN